MNEVLIVSATRSEAAYVPSRLPLLICGIGKVSAAIAMTQTLANHANTTGLTVLNVGTAGALRPATAGLFVPSVVHQHDISSAALRSMGYPVIDRYDLPGGDGSEVATGDTFVADPVQRDVLAARAGLVDMEAFAIAQACSHFGVACRLVKVVSDDADEGAMDWPARVDTAARLIGEWLERNVPA
ncbi:nucleosidase [Gordonia rubripertincta]|uniref:Nucleosidase n=1 Tax=Gordonia rubripertincta TaxID=36822 RepID=A0ABT4MN86_GORRU|nr:nucleosidase [Gordonia rubripertincta]MCZ4548459.1 nucleosidase [Gordonia rubripertincta]